MYSTTVVLILIKQYKFLMKLIIKFELTSSNAKMNTNDVESKAKLSSLEKTVHCQWKQKMV